MGQLCSFCIKTKNKPEPEKNVALVREESFIKTNTNRSHQTRQSLLQENMQTSTSNKTSPKKDKLKSPQKFVSPKKGSLEHFVVEESGSIYDKYNELKLIGEGAFGKCYKMINKLSKEIRAVKSIAKYGKSTSTENDILVEAEVGILQKMDHANIMKLLEFYKTSNNYYLVTEFLQGGELFDHITSSGPFDEIYVATIMHQILSAVNYCHKMNIIHRDLKPENIIFEDVLGNINNKDSKKTKMNRAKTESCNLQIKIIDFGCAKIFQEGVKEAQRIGSAYYMAPEVISQNYDEKCDLFSCGVIMYILLTGLPPFNGKTEGEIFKKIASGNRKDNKVFETLTPICKELIDSLLMKDPFYRPSAEEALNHEWFKICEAKEQTTFLSFEKITKIINNIKKYNKLNMLQDSALGFLVHHSLNSQQLIDARKLFAIIDKDNSGTITREELYQHLNEYLLSINEEIKNLKEEVDKIFDIVDSNGNNSIEYNEFLRAAVDKDILINNDNLVRQTFNFFDKDKSGEIEKNELLLLFGNQTEKAKEFLNKVFKEVDLDGDSKVSYDEFKNTLIKILN